MLYLLQNAFSGSQALAVCLDALSKHVIHSFIHSFLRSFVRSTVRSFDRSFVRSFIHSFIHSFILWTLFYLWILGLARLWPDFSMVACHMGVRNGCLTANSRLQIGLAGSTGQRLRLAVSSLWAGPHSRRAEGITASWPAAGPAPAAAAAACADCG